MNQDVKIAMIIAPKGFQDVEYHNTKKYLEEHGAHIDVYSTSKGTAYGSLHGTVHVEHTLADLKVEQYRAIVFIGGPGTPTVRADAHAVAIAKAAVEQGKVLAAICGSPTILAKAGLLKGKRATVWHGPDDEMSMMTNEYLQEQGAQYTGEAVTVDGNIITANGPSAAEAFAEAIWHKFKHKQ